LVIPRKGFFSSFLKNLPPLFNSSGLTHLIFLLFALALYPLVSSGASQANWLKDICQLGLILGLTLSWMCSLYGWGTRLLPAPSASTFGFCSRLAMGSIFFVVWPLLLSSLQFLHFAWIPLGIIWILGCVFCPPLRISAVVKNLSTLDLPPFEIRLLMGLYFIVALTMAMIPSTFHDSLNYHLAGPQYWVLNGGLQKSPIRSVVVPWSSKTMGQINSISK